ncbi:MAG TPA: ABC transporter substrate-binding protein [Gaiellaceae bacterium]|nr:ABC transporter substrate-binding protein [Gaiellaceae bacterium]
MNALFRLLAIALVVLASLAAGGCGGDDEAGDGTGTGAVAETGERMEFELVIGPILPLTGDLASFGPSQAEAARIAVEQIQGVLDAEGLSDVTVTLLPVEDDGGRSQAGVEAATKHVQTDEADVLLGTMASSVTIPIAESVAIPNEVVQITPTSTAPEITDLEDDDLVFRILSSDNLQGSALVDAVADAFGNDATINVGARNDAFGTALKELFEQGWEEGGGTIGASVTWNPEAPSFDTEAGQLAGGSPDGWVIIDFPETFARVGPALVRAGGWDPTMTFMTEAMRNAEELQNIGAQATEGLRGTAPTSEDAPARDAFDALFEQEAEEGSPLTGFEGASFDAVLLAFLAALDAGSSDPNEMKGSLQAVSGPPGEKYTFEQLDQAVQALLEGEDIDYEGAWGPIDFDENGDPGSAIYEVWQFDGSEVTTQTTFTFEGGE